MMNLNEAINIVAAEAVWCRRMADDMAELKNDARMQRARELWERAEAMDKLVNVARAFGRVAEE